MEIYYSEHIKNRLKLRRIIYDLPRRILEQSEERYFDVRTGHNVAVMKVNLYNKIREVMVAYGLEENNERLLTIHPLKEGQKENRIQSGRWRRI